MMRAAKAKQDPFPARPSEKVIQCYRIEAQVKAEALGQPVHWTAADGHSGWAIPVGTSALSIPTLAEATAVSIPSTPEVNRRRGKMMQRADWRRGEVLLQQTLEREKVAKEAMTEVERKQNPAYGSW